MGTLVYDLGNVYHKTGIQLHNTTSLFQILQASPEDMSRYYPDQDPTQQMKETLDAIDAIMAPLAEAQMQRPDADLIRQEFSWAADMLRHACHRAIWVWSQMDGDEDRTLKQRLLSDAQELIAAYKRIWHARNRPGGFVDSVARMEKMRNSYTS